MAQNADWGPPMWKLLHSMAERAGSSVLQVDEVRAWIQVLRLTEAVLPCAMCRAHYKEWRTRRPLDALLPYRAEMFKERVREWLWELHESVNASRGLESFPIERLEIYRGVDTQELNQNFAVLVKIFEAAILYRQVNPTYVAEWRRAVILLRKLLT